MRWRSVLAILAAVLSACSFPLSGKGKALVAFDVVFPPVPGVSAASSRLLAPETVSIRVTVKTVGTPDQVQTFAPVVDTTSGQSKARIEVMTTIGQHTFVVESLDGTNTVLTSGQVTQILTDGSNPVSLTLTPATTLANGSAVTLAANQVGYYTVPGASLALFQLAGLDSTFWEGAADGTFPGTGTAGTLTVDVTGGADKVLRVVQGTAGSFTAVIPQVAAVTFTAPGGTYGEDQLVALSDGTPGASITYSVDGGATYLPYTAPIAVAGNGTTKTILARATAPGYTASVTTSQTYTIQYSGVTINFALPTDPVILGVNGLLLNAANSDTLTVALDTPAAFTNYTWFIDGTPGQYQMISGWVFNGQAFTQTGNSLVVESQYMTSGLHEVMVIVSDATGTYSARFTVEVIR